MHTDLIRKELQQAADVLSKFLSDEENIQAIGKAAELIIDSIRNGGTVYSCGNGGSMCDAMHFAEELSGRFRADRKALPAISISDPSHITCVANDYGFEHIFSRYVDAMGKKNDILFAISTSGNSRNIINAVKAAKEKGMKVIGLTGKDGGALKSLVDVEIRAPHSEFSDRVQEIHIKVIHTLILIVEKSLS